MERSTRHPQIQLVGGRAVGVPVASRLVHLFLTQGPELGLEWTDLGEWDAHISGENYSRKVYHLLLLLALLRAVVASFSMDCHTYSRCLMNVC